MEGSRKRDVSSSDVAMAVKAKSRKWRRQFSPTTLNLCGLDCDSQISQMSISHDANLAFTVSHCSTRVTILFLRLLAFARQELLCKAITATAQWHFTVQRQNPLTPLVQSCIRVTVSTFLDQSPQVVTRRTREYCQSFEAFTHSLRAAHDLCSLF